MVMGWKNSKREAIMKKTVNNLWVSLLTLFCVFMMLGIANSFAQTVIVADKLVEPNELPDIPYFSGEPLQASPFPAPNRPSGIDLKNNEILMISEQAGTLYVVNPDDGSLIRTVDLPGISDADPGSYGIVAIDNFWWHADYQRAKLYKLNPGDGAILEELPMPSRYLGIAWDGNNLWGASPNDRRLYRIDTSTGNILETISLSTADGPIDLTWDGTNLWVSERDGSEFHQIDVNGNILRTESASVPNYLLGIAAQNPYIWIGSGYDSMLYRFDVGLPTLTLEVPFFSQNDMRWAEDQLGDCTGWYIGWIAGQSSYPATRAAGCATTSKAMVFNYYHPDYTDPGSLNICLTENGGYARGCLAPWDDRNNICVPSGISFDGHIKEKSLFREIINSELLAGRPVIAQVRTRKIPSHFVVITGVNGSTCDINDPWDSEFIPRTLDNGALGSYKIKALWLYLN